MIHIIHTHIRYTHTYAHYKHTHTHKLARRGARTYESDIHYVIIYIEPVQIDEGQYAFENKQRKVTLNCVPLRVSVSLRMKTFGLFRNMSEFSQF